MRKIAILAAALAALTACGGISEKKLWKKIYKQSCKDQFECDATNALATYGDEKGCREFFIDEIERQTDYYRPCEYDPGAAKDWYKATKKLDCESTEDDYAAAQALFQFVYECPTEPTGSPTTTTEESRRAPVLTRR